MIQTTHKILPTQLSSTFQKCLALEALASNNISELARKNNTTRKTIYKYKDRAVTAIDNHFDNLKDDEVLYHIPVTKGLIKTAVVILSGVCKSSERDIKSTIYYMYDYSISTGSISYILNEISDTSGKVNNTYTFENCKDSTSDECYHRGDPILSVADIPSKFCLLLEREDNLNQGVWEMYLEDLKTRGYYPKVNILDGGTAMNPAYNVVFTKSSLRYDHFHILKTIKEVLRFLKNKKESAETYALKCLNRFTKKTTEENQTLYEVASNDMSHYENVHANASNLLTWMQYDVLQLPAANPSDRSDLFEFIIDELQLVAKEHPHRISDLITTFKNQKTSLLDVAESLNTQFQAIAETHKVPLDTVWRICYLARFDFTSRAYNLQSLELDAQLGDTFDLIEDEVLHCIATTYRTSSVIENLNSRLRPYIDARKGFKSNRYSFIQFMLNHLPFQRSANPNHKGKSPAEIFTGNELPEWTELLGLKRFKRAA